VELKGPGPMKAWSVYVRACGVFEAKHSRFPNPGNGVPQGSRDCQF
jgi:hypothetical protein